MRPFIYERAANRDLAIKSAQMHLDSDTRSASVPVHFLAGGTTLLDLMKLDVMRPAYVVDVSGLGGDLGAIQSSPDMFRLGGLVRMSEAIDHPALRRELPLLVQSLELAASQQLRNMATLAGNVLQRTRCLYFRDTSWRECNK